MIEFFRDVLDGPLYIITTILSIIFIMAIIGFLMERKKLEKEEKEKIAVIATPNEVQPIEPVTVEKEVETPIISNEQIPISDFKHDDNPSLKVETPTIIFEDIDQKKE